MKIALCLAGLTNNYETSYPILKRELLDKYNPDIYMHGWESDSNRKNQIINLYCPKKSLLEPQKNFNEEIESCKNVWKIKEAIEERERLFKMLSYTYSRKKSFELIENEKEYECIIIARYDVYAWHGTDLIPMSKIIFYPEMDMSYIYTKDWEQKNAGFMDLWLYSNFENMKKICNLYDYFIEYLTPGHQYSKWLIGDEGWPYSKEGDEFSNEIDLPEEKRSKIRRKHIYEWDGSSAKLNSHYFYKCHALMNNIYEKIKYL